MTQYTSTRSQIHAKGERGVIKRPVFTPLAVVLFNALTNPLDLFIHHIRQCPEMITGEL